MLKFTRRLAGPSDPFDFDFDFDLTLLRVLSVVSIDDGTKELCPLPKRESDFEASKDRSTNMQGLFLQGLRNRGTQHHHRSPAFQTRRPRCHRSIWGERCVFFRIFHIYFRLLIARTDSTVLAYVMKTLNERYQYGRSLFLLSIDEGITGYRDDSLEVSTNGRSSFLS